MIAAPRLWLWNSGYLAGFAMTCAYQHMWAAVWMFGGAAVVLGAIALKVGGK